MLFPIFIFACIDEFKTITFSPEILSAAPTSGTVANIEDNVLFSVTIEDKDSYYNDVLVRIESDIEGVFLSGSPDGTGQFNQSYDALKLGTHSLTITVIDESNNYASLASDITINALPALDAVLIFPENPTTDDDLEVFITQGTDLDNDLITLEYRWYRNGAIQPELTADRVSSDMTQKGDLWMVEIIPFDEYGAGQPVSTSTYIRNQAPSIESVTITPDQAIVLGTELNCVATGSDNDEEAITETYLWQILSNGNYYDFTSNLSAFTPAPPLVQPGDEIRCSVFFTDNDEATSDTAYDTVEIINRDPFIDDITLLAANGDNVRSGATLECIGTASDPDESDILLSYIWKNGSVVLAIDNDVPNGSPSELLLTDNNARRDDVITCEVTATDEHGGSTSEVSAGALVVNTAPVMQSIGINLAPTSQDSITCIPVSTDIDGDDLTYDVVWTVNSNTVQTGDAETLNGPFAPLDEVTCTFTPDDSQSFDGTGTSLSASTTILNTLPEITDITLSPSLVQTESLLTATVEATDIDGSLLSLNYAWYVDGNLVKSGLGNNLDGTLYFQRNQQVYVAVTPNDGLDDGVTVISDVITIENTPPVILSAMITPELPLPETDDLICTTEDPVTDPDNDTLSFSFVWTKNGEPYTGGTTDSYYANDTIPAIFTQDGDIFQCQMVVDDGFDTASADSSEVLTACENGYGDIEGCPAESCFSIIEERPSQYGDDGIYWLDPDGTSAAEAYCDMTHDGGGWTLVMKAVGSDALLAYDQIYWESTALLNPNDLNPNEDETGSSSKYDAYNRVLGTTLRLEFLTPSAHNIHLNDMGFCSDGSSLQLDDCIAIGTCEDPQWGTENDCIANGSCSDVQYTNDTDCSNAGAIWTPLQWTPQEWTDGLTPLELFSGPEIMIQGDVLGYGGGCRSGLLTQDFTGDMQFAYQSQFFGINGYNHSTSGQYNANRYSKIRFGYGSGIADTTDSGWAPQIGIGIYVRYYRYLQYDYTYQYSTAWLDPDATNGCGTYGNGLGAAAEDASSNLWIR